MSTELENSWESFLKQPSEKTFSRLYQEVLPLVYTICYRLTKNSDDADDACQSTYSRLIREVKTKAHDSTIPARTYICRTAAREADALRKRQSRHAHREITMENISSAINHQSDPRSENQLRLTVERMLEELPEDLRVPVQLHYLHGFSHQEIADTLEVPRTTLTSRMKKALSILEEKLKGEGISDIAKALSVLLTAATLLKPEKALSASAVWSSATAGASAISLSSLLLSTKGVTALLTVAVLGITAAALYYHESINEKELDQTIVETSQSSSSTFKKNENAIPEEESIAMPVSLQQSEPAQSQKAANDPSGITDLPYRLTGVITDEQENPIPGVTVRFGHQFGHYMNKEVKTDVDGRYTLGFENDQALRLAAYGQGWAPTWRDTIIAGPKEKPNVVNLTLEKAITMKGLVQDEEGNPLPGVTIRPYARGRILGYPLPGHEEGVTTGEDGSFKLPDVPSEILNFKASLKGYSTWEGEADTVDMARFTLKPSAYIFGYVTDAETGAPITNYTIDFLNNFTNQEVEHPEGEIYLDNLSEGEARWLKFSAEGYLPYIDFRVFPSTVDDHKDLEIKLTKGLETSVEIIDAETATPIPGAQAFNTIYQDGFHIEWSKLDRDWEPSRINPASTLETAWGDANQQGIYTFKDDPNLPRTIGIWTPGYARMLITPENREQWKVGEASYVVALRKGGTVGGFLSFDGAGYRDMGVSLSPSRETFNGFSTEIDEAEAGEDGWFEWESLPAGKYTFSVERKMHWITADWYSIDFELGEGENRVLDLHEPLGIASVTGKLAFEGNIPEGKCRIWFDPIDRDDFQMHIAADGFGNFQADYLKEGKYRVKVSESINHSESRSFTEIIDIQDGKHIELSFDPKVEKKRVKLSLDISNLSQEILNRQGLYLKLMPADEITYGVTDGCELREGHVTIESELSGDVRLAINCNNNESGTKTIFTTLLPEVYTIAEDSMVTNLGELTLPALYPVDIKFNASERAAAGKDNMIIFASKDKELSMDGMSAITSVPPEFGEFERIHFLPEGEYYLAYNNPEFPPDQIWHHVTVGPDLFPEVTYTLSDTIQFFAMVFLEDFESPVEILSVSLISDDGEISRTIDAGDTVDMSDFVGGAFTEDGDFIVPEMNFIRFGNLKEGPATLTVNVKGHHPKTVEIEMDDPENKLNNVLPIMDLVPLETSSDG